MTNRTTLFKYFLSILEFSQLSNVKLKENAYEISKEKILSGIVDEVINTDFFEKNKISTLPIIISLYSIQYKNQLLSVWNIPAILSADGNLSFDFNKHGYPWIPIDCLKITNHNDLCFSSLHEYYQILNQIKNSEPNFKTFTEYITFCDKVFSQVSLSNVAYQVIKQPYILKNNRIIATQHIQNLYSELIKSDDNHLLLTNLLNFKSASKPDIEIDTPTTLLENMLNTVGSMNGVYPLSPSQRKAVHAFINSTNGDILPISGPPGTGKTTLLQAIVANTIVKNALEGKKAPIIVGTSATNQAVTNIIDSFSGISSQSNIIDHRWLYKYNVNSDGNLELNDWLTDFATYFPSSSKIKSLKDRYTIDNSYKNMAYSSYSSDQYIYISKQHFIDLAKQMDIESNNLEDIRYILHQKLKDVDNIRREILCEVHQLNQLDNDEQLNLNINELEKTKEESINRLNFWTNIQPKRKWYQSKKKYNLLVSTIIMTNITSSEQKIIGNNNIEDIIQFYLKDIEEKNSKIFKLKEIINKKNIIREKLSHLIYQGNYYLKFIDNKHPEFSDIDTLNLETTDEILDTTLRYIEFWLSIHIYESDWLLSYNEYIEDNRRSYNYKEIMDIYWRQMSYLTPCFVMTEHQLPKIFSYFDLKKRKTQYYHDFIDLLITDEAGQVDTTISLGSLSLAKKAVIVGDTHQLDPVWSFDPDVDSNIALLNGINKNDWLNLQSKGLTASNPSSLMLAAQNASKWFFYISKNPIKKEGGLFLSEHRRCVDEIIEVCNELIYNGLLEPKRGSAKEQSGIMLYNYLPPFGAVIIKDSESITKNNSRQNIKEAKCIIKWINDYYPKIKKSYPNTPERELLGIVTPFKQQATLIENELKKSNILDDYSNITVGTAHRLQGAERKVILFSSVYGRNDSTPSFINNNISLTNVAVSRAKDCFIVFASDYHLNSHADSKTFKLFYKYANSNIVVSKI